MTTRIAMGKLLVVLALPLVFLGLIDPLEGGLALLAAVVAYAVAGWLLREWPPRYLWTWFVATLVVGVGTLAVAIVWNPLGPGTSEPDTALNPMRGPLLIGLGIYRLLDVITLGQATRYAIKVVKR